MGSIGTTTSKRKITADDISTLRTLLGSSAATCLHTPESTDYTNSIKRWSVAAQKPAGVVLTPTTNEEIAIAVKYAVSNGIDLAVKGGGHSTAGVSSTSGGLSIDLNAKLRGVTVDTTQKQLRIQGGATWGDVDQAGAQHGLATVGSTVADTGVGGLTLGGGYGFLSGQRGLVIDNLVEATVVTASGEILTASKTQNADLFWALAGAGQNFGVTTEFVLQAYEQGDVWAGLLIFPPVKEVVEKVVAAINDLYTADANGVTKVAGRGCGGLVLMRPPPDHAQVALGVQVIYFGTEEQGKEMFKSLYEIGPVADTTAVVPYPTVNTLLAPPIGMRASMKGAAYAMPIRPEYVNEMVGEFVQFTDGNDDAKGSILMWELYDAAKVVQFQDNGSFANRGWHLNGLILPMWTKEENDMTFRQWARDMNEKFKKELEIAGLEAGKGVEGGVGVRGSKGAVLLYGNYDQYDEKSRDIFGDNYPRLQKLKAKYDPTNAFDKLFAITPAA
ncbi:hypothetical protein B0A52_07852 [Exophiala mesophila]|uniref:FAD-binding PCMH-type domain-containing protein n=1 Tax=Exophiala mesophila TaxID=212818 RepID=A0A438MVE0_EXOME|nr:hypothetical protein B0A52_07852 [Exophiala mesophila]